MHTKHSYHTARGLTIFATLTSTRGLARRRVTTDARPLQAAQCRGVEPFYRDRGDDDEKGGATLQDDSTSRVEGGGTKGELRGRLWRLRDAKQPP